MQCNVALRPVWFTLRHSTFKSKMVNAREVKCFLSPTVCFSVYFELSFLRIHMFSNNYNYYDSN
jgi:hypothetical protein